MRAQLLGIPSVRDGNIIIICQFDPVTILIFLALDRSKKAEEILSSSITWDGAYKKNFGVSQNKMAATLFAYLLICVSTLGGFHVLIFVQNFANLQYSWPRKLITNFKKSQLSLTYVHSRKGNDVFGTNF